MLGEMQCRVSVKLLDGSVVSGWIEYYDRRMVRLTREGGPNLFIFKHEIAYIAEDVQSQLRSGSLPGVKNGNSTSAT
jgi:host factor-I protein